MPEELPTPEKSLKQLEKENKKKFDYNKGRIKTLMNRCGFTAV